MSDLPRDPDLDELPVELAEHEGPLRIRARDPETSEIHEALVTREDVAAALADARRARDDHVA